MTLPSCGQREIRGEGVRPATLGPVPLAAPHGVKLWIDECLSPTLVARANRRGYWAICNRDRDPLGVADEILHELVIDEEAVLSPMTKQISLRSTRLARGGLRQDQQASVVKRPPNG